MSDTWLTWTFRPGKNHSGLFARIRVQEAAQRLWISPGPSMIYEFSAD